MGLFFGENTVYMLSKRAFLWYNGGIFIHYDSRFTGCARKKEKTSEVFETFGDRSEETERGKSE